MATYSNMLVTNGGKTQYAKVMAGKTISFTRVAFGGGSPASQTEAENLTGLVQQLIEGSIESIDNTTIAGVCVLTVTVSNANITSPIGIKEIGLYSKIGDETNEVMYAYCYSPTDIDVIPSNTTGSVTWKMRLQLAISNTSANTSTQSTQLTHTPTITAVSADGTTSYISVAASSTCRYSVKDNFIIAYYEITGSLANMAGAEDGLTSVTISLPRPAQARTAVQGRMTVPYTRQTSNGSVTSDVVVDVTGTIESGSSVISVDYLGLQNGTFTLLIPVVYLV